MKLVILFKRYLAEPVDGEPSDDDIRGVFNDAEESEDHPIGQPLSVVLLRSRFNCLDPVHKYKIDFRFMTR